MSGRVRSSTFNHLSAISAISNPLENPNRRLCIFKQVERVRAHALVKINPSTKQLQINESLQTTNRLTLICESNSTADACVKMIALDAFLNQGRSHHEILSNLPSSIISERKNLKSNEGEQIFQSLTRLIPGEGYVVKNKIPRQSPIKTLAKAIEKHGSMILPISEGNLPHHWVVLDNVVKVSSTVTPINPYPMYGFIYRNPLDGTHGLSDASEFVKLLKEGDSMYQLSSGIETPMSPVSTDQKEPMEKGSALDLTDVDQLEKLNPTLPLPKVAKLYNTAFATKSPFSYHETPEPLLRKVSDEESPTSPLSLSKKMISFSLEGGINRVPSEESEISFSGIETLNPEEVIEES